MPRANTLTGGDGNDTLNGGSGADTHIGGLGDDLYVVDNASDSVTENSGGGTDTVQSAISYTLGSNVENLTLTGSSALNGTGNTLNNTLTGHTGINTLSGLAGDDILEGKTGNDSMTGGDGADVYRCNSGDGADTINNVSGDSATDRLVFSDVARTQLSFSQSGNDLLISRVGSGIDSVRVSRWFSATGNRIDIVETTGGQTTTAHEIDALIGGGGGSFPNSIVPPPEFLMARPPMGFERAIVMDAAEAADFNEPPMRRNHLPVAGLHRPITAAGLSGEASGLVREFKVLQMLVTQPHTLWDGMKSGSEKLTCPVLGRTPELAAHVPVMQPNVEDTRINNRVGATLHRFVSAMAAFDSGEEVSALPTCMLDEAAQGVIGIEPRTLDTDTHISQRRGNAEFRSPLA